MNKTPNFFTNWFFTSRRARPLRNLYYGVGNFFDTCSRIIRWLPVLWKDRESDCYHILRILQFKIAENRRFLSKQQRHVGWEKNAEQMRRTELVIQRLMDEEYAHWYLLDRPDGQREDVPGEDLVRFRGSLHRTPFTEQPFDPGHSYYERRKQDPYVPKTRMYFNFINVEERMKAQDYEHLFKLLGKHLSSWWT
jgi:hypothetical protein